MTSTSDLSPCAICGTVDGTRVMHELPTGFRGLVCDTCRQDCTDEEGQWTQEFFIRRGLRDVAAVQRDGMATLQSNEVRPVGPVEPEAAFLRNVLRRILAIADSEAGPGHVLREIEGLCHAALKRPATNGEVIDRLQQKVAELSAAPIDIHAYKVRAEVAERRAAAAETERDALKAGGTRYESHDVEAVVDAAAALLCAKDARDCAIAESATLTRAMNLAERLPEKEWATRGDEILRLLRDVVNAANATSRENGND